MNQLCAGSHVCCAVLRGKSKVRLFERETQKKWLLDAVVEETRENGCAVLAYCVLDNELSLVLCAGEEKQWETCVEGIMKQFVSEHPIAYGRKKVWRKPEITAIGNARSVAYYCVKLHMLPVRLRLVDEPGDYWWCSYRDYMGRRWLPVTETEILMDLLHESRRSAARIFLQRHRKK